MIKEEIIKVTGMTCAVCSGTVEKTLKKTSGIFDTTVNFATGEARVKFDTDIINLNDIHHVIKKTGYGVKENTEKDLTDKENFYKDYFKKMIFAWIFSAPLMIVMMITMTFGMPHNLHHLYNWVAIIFTLIVFIFPARNTFISAFKSIKNLAPTMDVLIALGSISALITGLLPGMSDKHSFIEIASMIIAIHLTGRYIEAKTKGKTSEAIRKLMELGAKAALIIKNKQTIEIPVSDLQINDIMLIKPGAKIPTDGTIIDGESFIDESMATGESMPVKKTINNTVLGATINGSGILKVKVSKIGKDTFLSQMISLVEHAQNTKVTVQAFADKITGIFVPIVLLIALLSFIIHLLFPEVRNSILDILPFSLPWISNDLPVLIQAIFSAISVLVIACPCALGLATPTAIMAGIGLGTKHGIIIKNGEAVQLINKIKTIIFDKTGTLTEGKPIVTDMIIIDNEQKIDTLKAVYSLESLSNHPLAQAIINKLNMYEFETKKVTNFQNIDGKGITGSVDNEIWYIGNQNLLTENNIDFLNHIQDIKRLQEEAKTIVLVANHTKLSAILAISDQIKTDAFSTIKLLQKMNIKTVMLTGDNLNTALQVAKKLNIDEVKADILPSDKLHYVKTYQKNGNKVLMVGDGINDAPALKQADVSIAIGGGTDIAIESADIVLVRNEVLPVVKAILLGKNIFRTIKQNLFWAFFYNLIAIPLSFFGLLHPVIAEIAMALSSITVVSNANRLRNNRLQLPLTNFKKVILDIQGMSCQHCVMRIKSILEKFPEIKSSKVSLENNQAEIIVSDNEYSSAKIKNAIADANFTVTNEREIKDN
ncbi:MAG: heavy metal translocating P-type ATPase [Candidatus Cloacimonetes bacterium]|nr:heavy metal translocating P-type ATPase [Candidatus Cloacimonadota bacterium]